MLKHWILEKDDASRVTVKIQMQVAFMSQSKVFARDDTWGILLMYNNIIIYNSA